MYKLNSDGGGGEMTVGAQFLTHINFCLMFNTCQNATIFKDSSIEVKPVPDLWESIASRTH